MIFKMKMPICLTIVFVFISAFSSISYSAKGQYPEKKVLIVYAKRYIFGFKTDYVNAFGLLLKHFNTDIAYVDIIDYKQGDVEKYDVAFYLGIEKEREMNEAFLKDMAASDKKVCWVGNDAERFLQYKKEIEVQFEGMSGEFVYSTYKGRSYLEKRKTRDVLIKPLGSQWKVWSEISNGSASYPYVMNRGNVWIFSRLDMGEGPGNYIMADVLHELMEEPHEEKRKAFIRIEDIHPFRDVNETKETLDVLVRNKVPFMMAVIPAYYNGGDNTLTYLFDKPKLTKVIRYGIDNGGSVILHGFTHQESHSATGEGFEFWDANRDKPLNVDEEAFLRDRLNRGVLECIRNDIYPVAFEPPHYAMSQKGYGILSDMFSTLVAQVQTSDEGFSTISYPYMLYNTYCAEFVVPENLSYIDPKKINPLDEIRRKADELKIVRDSTAGVFFHPYVKTEYLEDILKTLRNEGYDFFDLYSLNNRVRTKNAHIYNIGTEVFFNLHGTTLKELKADKETLIGKFVRLYSWGMFLIVAFVCSAFFIIYLLMRSRETKSLFENKEE